MPTWFNFDGRSLLGAHAHGFAPFSILLNRLLRLIFEVKRKYLCKRRLARHFDTVMHMRLYSMIYTEQVHRTDYSVFCRVSKSENVEIPAG